MADPVSIGLGAAGAAGGIISGISNAVLGAKQLKLQKEQFAYQKELNKTMMEREDTAVQRRADDMAAAGINKNLAAGSPAETSSMSAGAPLGAEGAAQQSQGIAQIGESMGMAMNMYKSVEEIKNMQAQNRLLTADEQLRQQELLNEQLRSGLIRKDDMLKLQEITKMQWNQKYAEEKQLPHGQPLFDGIAKESAILNNRKKGTIGEALAENMAMMGYGLADATKNFFSSAAPHAFGGKKMPPMGKMKF